MTKRKRKKLSWKPVRRGDVYCAPACGRGCKLEEYDRAVAGAEALAKDLGRGWKVRVWENLGWFFEVSRGGLRVSPILGRGNEGPYMAFLDRAGEVGAIWSEDGETAREAIHAVIWRARKHVAELMAILADGERGAQSCLR